MVESKMILEWAKASYRTEQNQKAAIRKLRDFLAFTKMAPEELVKEQRAKIDERAAQRRILAFYKKIIDAGKTPTVAFDYTKFLRSFYNYYGLVLSFRPNELEMPLPKIKDFPFELQHIQGMIYAANVKGKALILTLESSGLRIGDIVKLLRKDIEPLLEKEPPVELEVITEKERVRANSFLHSVAIKALKDYLASRTDDFPWLFTTDLGSNLSTPEADRMVKTAFKNAGFDSGNLRVRTHCIRKFTIGQFQDSGIEENLWKAIVGKKTPQAAYNSNKLREAYISALPKLNPEALVNNHVKMDDLANKVQTLEKENLELRQKLTELEQKKGFEVLMEMYQDRQKEINKDAFNKAAPAKASLNGKKPAPTEPITINGSEILSLKALAQSLQLFYDKKKKEGQSKNE